MTPEEKIMDHFRSVSPDKIRTEDGYVYFYLDVFDINIRIRKDILEGFSVKEILQTEKVLLEIDDEITNHLRKLLIRRY